MSKYAIIQTGSKQYKVSEGDVIDVELIDGDAGSAVEFADVLFHFDGKSAKIGAPSVAGALVKGQVLDQVRGPKVVAYKYKRTKRSTRRKVGHRQDYTRVRITEV